MSNRVTWFERAFNFDFPVGYFGDILERLEGGPVRVEAKVRGLASAALTKRLGKTWSIQENVGHFGDLEPLWAGRLDDFLDGKEVLRDADLTDRAERRATLDLFRSYRYGGGRERAQDALERLERYWRE